ncbi:hypothetical protein GALMADRAFT_236510 [Galerina marginata CBS 339.88]|uniref:RING-type domain-containing protein n=1 Tax=Galerina marginata (strain CBS 339.88) TaxID=685588 RepID=A0A067TLA4_GALM3|nr:hypothetical protein GALMADRAFT_236510 [Galerina marginata CBS 339.88]
MQAQEGVQRLKRQNKALRKERDTLKVELGAAMDPLVPKRSRKRRSNSASDDDTSLAEIRVLDLEKKYKELQAENHRQKKRIEKFKKKELRREVEDLQGSKTEKNLDEGDLDPEHRMRKLLRKFSDLMLVATIPDDMSQSCSICYETLRLKKCSALECQHLICHDCLPRISKGADETVECPECRRVSSRDELELVYLTERDRWDRLLDIAQAWDAFDVRGEEETIDEEAEENFMTDRTRTSEVSSESEAGRPSSEAASTADDDRPSTPPPVSHNRPFSESPTKEKRKILEQLAEDRTRAQKRRK